jgi:hypothetical protein
MMFHGDAAGPVPPPTKADYRQLVEVLEPVVRGPMVDALKKAGFSKQAASDARAAPAADVERFLGRIRLLPQFLAVRDAHAALSSAGPSPATSGLLVRGYANLGQLTMLY